MWKSKTIQKVISISQLWEYYDEPKFGKLCQACSNYGRLWSCPPYKFDIEGLLRGQKMATIFGTLVPTLAHSATEAEQFLQFDTCRIALDKSLLEVEYSNPDSLALFAGSCKHCKECTRTKGQKCRKEHIMRYSLESLGFDVVAIAKDVLDLEIDWIKEGKYPQNFTLISAIISPRRLLISTQDNI